MSDTKRRNQTLRYIDRQRHQRDERRQAEGLAQRHQRDKQKTGRGIGSINNGQRAMGLTEEGKGETDR